MHSQATRAALFANAEPGEYFSEQFVGEHFPGNEAQTVVCQA